MTKFKIYPKSKIAYVSIGKVASDTHFSDLFFAVLNHSDYDHNHNFLINAALTDWNHCCPVDILNTVDFLKDNKRTLTECVSVVNNLGQIAYIDAIMLGSEKFLTKYFTKLDLALNYLNAKEDII